MLTSNATYHRNLLVLGAVLGFIGIILGAYAAHGLKGLIPPEDIAVFQTGVRFQLYHALLALVVGSFKFISEKTMKYVFYLLLFGVLCFSGSIYGLSTNALTDFDFTKIALVTPLGGLLLILTWGVLIFNLLKIKTV